MKNLSSNYFLPSMIPVKTAISNKVTKTDMLYCGMRTNQEIELEIKKLQKLSQLPDRWNSQTREIIAEQTNALCARSTHKQVELALYEDETTEEFQDGDNELWTQVDAAVSWMNKEPGFEAPSKNAL